MEDGVVSIDRVAEGGLAQKQGVGVDDLVLRINGHAASDGTMSEERMRALAAARPLALLIRGAPAHLASR